MMASNADSIAGESASLLKMRRLGTTDSINSVAFQKSMLASQNNLRPKKGLNQSGIFSQSHFYKSITSDVPYGFGSAVQIGHDYSSKYINQQNMA